MFEPVVLFFVLGAAAAFLRSDLKIPGALYESLSIFLLLAIGLKGGVELAKAPLADHLGPVLAVVLVAALIPLVAFVVLFRFGGFARADAGAIAAHYGSVSVVTFAVGGTFLARAGLEAEGVTTLILVLLEFPALIIGVLLAKSGAAGGGGDRRWGHLLREVMTGKSIILLLGGLAIGWAAGPEGVKPLGTLFFDLFKGVLAFFLLEMGLVAASRFGDLRRAGLFLVAFAMLMPLAAGALGVLTGWVLGFSLGGTTLIAVLYASASYIAAPTAMRIAVPEANPALSIGASLGVTFPFNLLVGIPVYHQLARFAYGH